jgi:transposase
MGKALVLPKELEKYDFKKRYKKEKHPRLKMRLLAMEHLKEGIDYKEVGKMLKVHEKSVLSWIRRFREGGLEGLVEKGGRGKKASLGEEKYKEFREAVLKAEKEKKGGRLMGKGIKRILEKEFSVKLEKSSVYALLHKAGMSWVSSRSRHPKQDLEAQKSFKKTLQN